MTQQKGITEILTGDNLKTYIAENHYQNEIATGTPDGTGTKLFKVANIIHPIVGNATGVTGWVGSPLAQYTDASGNFYRRDAFVQILKNGKLSPLNTNTYPVAITKSSGSINISGSLPASVAGSIVVSYSNTVKERTDEITNFSISGGGRPKTYVVVQGGKRIGMSGVQEQRTVSIEALSVPDYGWVDYLNGTALTNTIGTDKVKGSTGTSTASPRTIVIAQEDPMTGNVAIDALFNVSQVSNDRNRPSEGQATETAAFECAPQDYSAIDISAQQG